MQNEPLPQAEQYTKKKRKRRKNLHNPYFFEFEDEILVHVTFLYK